VTKKGRKNTMPTKSNQLQHNYYPPRNETKKQAQSQVQFPSNRYFQIHFEYLESQLQEAQRSLMTIQAQLADLYLRLPLIASERIDTKEIK
jgi:hypothetical protein